MVFERSGDRWRHAFEVVAADGSVVRALASLEGNAEHIWPPSPPFQELSEETLPDGRRVIFLVGRAGTSHWSASFESNLETSQIVCDIACRHTMPPEELGSTYQQLAKGIVVDVAKIARLQTNAEQLQIAPIIAATRLPGTTQWKYTVSPKR
jgi:hypothetical protein